jgi:hypothetical protein
VGPPCPARPESGKSFGPPPELRKCSTRAAGAPRPWRCGKRLSYGRATAVSASARAGKCESPGGSAGAPGGPYLTPARPGPPTRPPSEPFGEQLAGRRYGKCRELEYRGLWPRPIGVRGGRRNVECAGRFRAPWPQAKKATDPASEVRGFFTPPARKSSSTPRILRRLVTAGSEEARTGEPGQGLAATQPPHPGPRRMRRGPGGLPGPAHTRRNPLPERFFKLCHDPAWGWSSSGRATATIFPVSPARSRLTTDSGRPCRASQSGRRPSPFTAGQASRDLAGPRRCRRSSRTAGSGRPAKL